MAFKAKTYGKKTTKSLAAEFARLHVSNEDTYREPLIERSSNERSLRLRDPKTIVDLTEKPRNAKSPARIFTQGDVPCEVATSPVISAAKASSSVSKDIHLSGNVSLGVVATISTTSPSGKSQIPHTPTPNISPVIQQSVAIDVHKLPAGETNRKRHGKRVSSTSAASLTGEDVDYLKPLTDIDEVISTVQRIEQWYEAWTRDCKIRKVAEGSFGSILQLQNKTDPTQFTIGKLMPLRQRKGLGSKTAGFTRIRDAASEAEMLITMSNYQGFAEFRRAEVLHGPLPTALRQEYRRYEACHPSDSEMAAKAGQNQLWLFLEMTYAGKDVEEVLKIRAQTNDSLNVRESWDIFWAVALALARGEENFGFEHRDLQIQNICIRPNCELLKAQDMEDRMGIARYTDLEVTIIDYTLSRATLENSRTIFNRMEDEGIFNGHGADSDEALQYDTYRCMRDIINSSSKKHERARKKNLRWEHFVPTTNVLWLAYLLKVLLTHSTIKGRVRAKEDGKLLSILEQLSGILSSEKAMDGGYLSAKDLINCASHLTRGIP